MMMMLELDNPNKNHHLYEIRDKTFEFEILLSAPRPGGLQMVGHTPTHGDDARLAYTLSS